MCTKTYRRLNVDFIAVFVSLHHKKLILNTSIQKRDVEARRKQQPTAPLYTRRVSIESHSFEARQRMVGGEQTRSRARKKEFQRHYYIFHEKVSFFFVRLYDWHASISLTRTPSPRFPLIHLFRRSVDCHLAQALFRNRQEENKNEQRVTTTRRRNPINFTFSFFSPFSDSFHLSHRGRFCTFYFLMKTKHTFNVALFYIYLA